MGEEIPATTAKRILNTLTENESFENCERVKRSETSHLCIPRIDKYRRRERGILKPVYGPQNHLWSINSKYGPQINL